MCEYVGASRQPTRVSGEAGVRGGLPGGRPGGLAGSLPGVIPDGDPGEAGIALVTVEAAVARIPREAHIRLEFHAASGPVQEHPSLWKVGP